MNDPELLSISQVGEATGLQSSALRYYEKAGLIASETRISGRRHYAPAVLERLAVVALFQEAGFTIREIRELMSARGRRRSWRVLAQQKLKEIDEHLDRVQAARRLLTAALECRCAGLETCELVEERRGRHRKTVEMLILRMGRSSDEKSSSFGTR